MLVFPFKTEKPNSFVFPHRWQFMLKNAKIISRFNKKIINMWVVSGVAEGLTGKITQIYFLVSFVGHLFWNFKDIFIYLSKFFWGCSWTLLSWVVYCCLFFILWLIWSFIWCLCFFFLLFFSFFFLYSFKLRDYQYHFWFSWRGTASNR